MPIQSCTPPSHHALGLQNSLPNGSEPLRRFLLLREDPSIHGHAGGGDGGSVGTEEIGIQMDEERPCRRLLGDWRVMVTWTEEVTVVKERS